jgi:hypothetical protein
MEKESKKLEVSGYDSDGNKIDADTLVEREEEK